MYKIYLLNLKIVVPIFLLSALIYTNSYAQKKPKRTPEQEQAIKDAQIWSPEPRRVTPGENNKPPSDAIILFDGKDLSHWTGVNGEAKWEVKDWNSIRCKRHTTYSHKKVIW